MKGHTALTVVYAGCMHRIYNGGRCKDVVALGLFVMQGWWKGQRHAECPHERNRLYKLPYTYIEISCSHEDWWLSGKNLHVDTRVFGIRIKDL